MTVDDLKNELSKFRNEDVVIGMEDGIIDALWIIRAGEPSVARGYIPLSMDRTGAEKMMETEII